MQVNPDHHYFWEQIHTLFGAVLVMDRDLRIIYASDSVTRYMPELAGAPGLLEIFTIKRPGQIETFDDALSHIGSLFLLIARDDSYALRGQVIRYEDQGRDVIIFCGAPWLFWINTKRPELRLHMGDFSAQDVQLDQLFYMTTEKRMVEDLEAMNTELQLAKQQLEEAQQAKNAFFAQMSHEMRTPLNGLASALALLREQSLPGEARQILDLARSSSRNLLRVINYVLDVSKIEASDEPEAGAVDLQQLISSTIDIVSARAQEKGIALTGHVDPTLARRYVGHRDRLQQCLLNLVVNAIKFTDRGSVAVEALPAAGGEDYSLRFEVNDTGIGIDKKDQGRIFEPFVSGDTTAVNAGERGTGLGLDIVRRNVERMHGRVGVSSAPGAGSSFWFELPMPEADDEGETGVRAPAEWDDRQRVESIDARIMLVDDNETNLMLGSMLFETLGMRVTPVGSGEEAVRLADPALHDLVFMDISMPGMDGYAATRAIREKFPSGELPIVALSAFASSVERTRAMESGMDAYLTKPMKRSEGVAVLQTFLPAGRIRFAGTDAAESAGAPGEVDAAVVDELRAQIGDDNLNRVIGKFLDEARRRWAALAAADDADARAREAHTLASTCGSFGLPLAADAIRKIEARAQRGEDEDPAHLLAVGDLLENSLVELEGSLSR